MAQLGARLNGIEKVVGSNPTGSTNNQAVGFQLVEALSHIEPGQE